MFHLHWIYQGREVVEGSHDCIIFLQLRLLHEAVTSSYYCSCLWLGVEWQRWESAPLNLTLWFSVGKRLKTSNWQTSTAALLHQPVVVKRKLRTRISINWLIDGSYPHLWSWPKNETVDKRGWIEFLCVGWPDLPLETGWGPLVTWKELGIDFCNKSVNLFRMTCRGMSNQEEGQG